MENYRVHFMREEITCVVPKGKTILEAEILARLMPDAPCGGKGKCGKCKVMADRKPVLACQTLVEKDLEVDTRLPESEGMRILVEGFQRSIPFSPGELSKGVEHPLLAAVDVGSTSVVAYLMDGWTGRTLGVDSMPNPQRQYGADVVMRGNYAMEKGAGILSSCIQEAVEGLLCRTAEACGQKAGDIVRIAMVGNSCMHHLFLGIPVDSLVLAPYEPKVKQALTLPAADYGMKACPSAQMLWLPNIGGFVGADTVGGLLASRLDLCEEPTLLVDIGTNGEMVLASGGKMAACSTAAGPAFEGAKITCGMRGSTGAIDHVWLEDGKLGYHTIDDAKPVGICGSGLLDAAACLLRCGLLDESGRLKETYHFTKDVFLNQKDIRELQLAKAAICAGIQLLCRHRGMEPGRIQKVLLAGAFGNYLDPGSACAIGMFPEGLKGRIEPIGNAAGEGAKIAALNQEEYQRSSQLAEQVEFLELALDPGFQEVYIDELEFPSGLEG